MKNSSNHNWSAEVLEDYKDRFKASSRAYERLICELRMLRRRNKISQQEIGRRLDWSVKRVSAFENVNNPSTFGSESVIHYAMAIGASIVIQYLPPVTTDKRILKKAP